MSDHKARPRLEGYMIIEDSCDDFSYWSGIITGPDDPTGANLAWENPIKMQEVRAGEVCITREKLRAAWEKAHKLGGLGIDLNDVEDAIFGEALK